MCIYVYIQIKLKDTENLFEMVFLKKSAIYFKINVYKLVKKYPRLQNLPLSAKFEKINVICEKKWQ